MRIHFNKNQRKLLRKFLSQFHNKEKTDLLKVFSAICHIVRTGCQWAMLPSYFPKPGVVYYHFRHWSDCCDFQGFLRQIVSLKRKRSGRKPRPSVAIIDSQSVRSAHAASVKGVDGYKKVKGIKRQIAVDAHGNPLCIDITPANVSDVKGSVGLLENLHQTYPSVSLVKADKGYRGTTHPNEIILECVKSNFGTSQFVPINGRWVVERTISWFDSYRRLCRNYEKYISTARSMAYIAAIMMVLKHL